MDVLRSECAARVGVAAGDDDPLPAVDWMAARVSEALAALSGARNPAAEYVLNAALPAFMEALVARGALPAATQARVHAFFVSVVAAAGGRVFDGAAPRLLESLLLLLPTIPAVGWSPLGEHFPAVAGARPGAIYRRHFYRDCGRPFVVQFPGIGRAEGTRREYFYPDERARAVAVGRACIGRQLKVQTNDRRWHPGRIYDYSLDRNEYLVVYEGGEGGVGWESLVTVRVEWLGGELEHPSETLSYSDADVGRRLKMYWPSEKAWFSGTVVEFTTAPDENGKQGLCVRYDDGDLKWCVRVCVLFVCVCVCLCVHACACVCAGVCAALCVSELVNECVSECVSEAIE